MYSACNIDVPVDVIDNVERRLFRFLWRNKRHRIKRAGVYQDYDNGRLRMVDVKTMIKALRLAWFPRLVNRGLKIWKALPNNYFRKPGGLKLLLNCNYRRGLPKFYRDMLEFFSELVAFYSSENLWDTILFNNKDILIGGEPFFNKEWLSKGICEIKDLLSTNGSFLLFHNFRTKYGLSKTNFLQFYQVINAIPKHLILKSRIGEQSVNLVNGTDLSSF